MKILLITQWYEPVKSAAAKRTGKIAHFLSDAGHEVTILTGLPNYPTGVLPPKYRGKLWAKEKDGQINILRTYEYPASTQAGNFKRLFNWLSFTKSAWIAALLMKPFDAVIVSSPSFFSGLAGLKAARSKKTKFYFDVRDLWPDSAIEMNILPATGLITNWLKNLEKKYYSRATKIFTATPGIKNHLLDEKIPDDKVEILLNSVDTNLFKPEKIDKTKLGFASDDFVCGYVGNMSRLYDLETVMKTAQILKDEPKIKFLFLGEGESKKNLIEMSQKMDLENVTFVSEKPLSELPSFVNNFDIGLAPIANVGVSQESFPSKISEYFSLAKPVLASLRGDMAEVIETHKVGSIYNPGDSEALAKIILELYHNPERTHQMGSHARELALEMFSDEIFKKKLLSSI